MTKRPHSPTFLEKLVEEGKSAAAKFVIGTALIGSFGYLLFTSPVEQQKIQSDAVKYKNLAVKVAESPHRDVNTIAAAYMSNDSAILNRTAAILAEITKNAVGQHLNSDFAAASDRWLSATISQIEIDRGRANGFVFTDALEQGMQRDTVALLGGQKELLTAIREIIVRWDTDNVAAREGRLETVATLVGQYSGRASGVAARAQQLATATKVAQAEGNQTGEEIIGRSNLHALKGYLAVAGIAGGVGLYAWAIVSTTRTRRSRSDYERARQ